MASSGSRSQSTASRRKLNSRASRLTTRSTMRRSGRTSGGDETNTRRSDFRSSRLPYSTAPLVAPWPHTAAVITLQLAPRFRGSPLGAIMPIGRIRPLRIPQLACVPSNRGGLTPYLRALSSQRCELFDSYGVFHKSACELAVEAYVAIRSLQITDLRDR